MPAIARGDITGLVLAGGRGSRMGGVDKGLQAFGETTLAAHALERLRPQVGALLISANRHLDDYAAMGVPVVVDEVNDFAGPLAGLLAGMRAASTPWLVSAPCDAPWFPVHLVSRLAAAGAAAVAVIDVDGVRHRQPVFCLVRTDLADSLHAFLLGGGRKAGHWLMQLGCIEVLFDDAASFDNLNTLEALSDSMRRGR